MRRLGIGIWAAVAVVAGALLLAPGAGTASAQAPAVCSDPDNFTHCEQVVATPGCSPATVYDNYSGDDFRSPYGSAAPGTYINVRNQPYRRHGARGVVVYFNGDWGFMSGNCLSGGL